MAKVPFIGQMDRVVDIIEKSMALDSATNAETSTENVIASPWAFMDDVSGGEVVDGKIKHLVDRTYTVRYDPLILAGGNKLVVKDGETRFEVLHVIELGRKNRLELRVKAYE